MQQAILDSDLPERLLDSLSDSDLVGLAVMAGSRRVPAAVGRPLLGPADYRGGTRPTRRGTA